MLNHLVAQLGSINLFIAKALAPAVDHQALGPRVRRRDEAPAGHRAKTISLRTRTLAQTQPAAITTGSANFPPALIVRRMLRNQLGVIDVATGGQDDTTSRPNQARLGMRLFKGRGFTPCSLRTALLKQAPFSHQPIELRMASGFRRTDR